MVFDLKNVKLIIGLGNPGEKYENTYHNAGFLLVDYLIENQRNSKFKIRHSRLLKSNVFMNESGAFVKKALKKMGAKPGELLLAHDDSDIELGKFKLSFGRGSAGHKGVESVIKALGTKNFWRIRIGVRTNPPSRPQAGLARRSPLRRAKAGEFVLKKIAPRDKKILEEVFEKASRLLDKE